MVQGTEKKRTFALVITAEEYELLRSPELVRAVAGARHRDPLEVAMDRRIPHARLVATQVKYLATLFPFARKRLTASARVPNMVQSTKLG